jgi:hypothetical protein
MSAFGGIEHRADAYAGKIILSQLSVFWSSLVGRSRAANQGAWREGNKAVGPFEAVGTVVGGTVGGGTGDVNGALGLSDNPKRKKEQTSN